MKTILISDHPKWCALMMNGDKKIEVRKGTALYKAIKKQIDRYGYADIYVYCTKDEKNLLHKNCANIYWVEDKDFKAKRKKLGLETQPYLNGKVPFKFRCYKVEEIKFVNVEDYSSDTYEYQTETLTGNDLAEQSCLKGYEINEYLSKNSSGCAIHISDLEIFDRPKELSEFRHYKRFDCYNADFDYTTIEYRQILLTKAPQSWCYVDVE